SADVQASATHGDREDAATRRAGIDFRQLSSACDIEFIDIRSAEVRSPEGGAVRVECEAVPALLSRSSVGHHLLSRGVEANDVFLVGDYDSAIGQDAQSESPRETGGERRKLLGGADVVTQDRWTFRGVEQRALIGRKFDLVGALILDGYLELRQQLSTGAEFQYGAVTTLLSHISIASTVEYD